MAGAASQNNQKIPCLYLSFYVTNDHLHRKVMCRVIKKEKKKKTTPCWWQSTGDDEKKIQFTHRVHGFKCFGPFVDNMHNLNAMKEQEKAL